MSESSSAEETLYRVFKILDADPQISQRALASSLGISLGKANYCLKEMVEKGFVKISNFTNSQNKRAYVYSLTPAGIEEKKRVTFQFLRHRLEEFESLKAEIAQLDQSERLGELHIATATGKS